MSRFQDLAGQQFGRWTVLSRAENNKKGQARWNCLCRCGIIRIVNAGRLKSDGTKSCGCLSRELTSKRETVHGSYGTKEYRTWQSMKKRCYNIKCPQYKDYGGRGIKVCDRWRDSFQNFLDDIGLAPTPKHSIDRIDNNGDYCKENCRWVTIKEQAINKRSNIMICKLCLKDYCKLNNLNYKITYQRIMRDKWSLERAFK